MFDDNQENGLRRKSFRLRLVVAWIFILLCFGVLTLRLWILQVERHDGLSARADRNRIVLVPISPKRGDIVDRNGVILAHSYRDNTIELIPSRVQNIDETIEEIGKILPLSPLEIKRFKRRLASSSRYQPVLIKNKLTDEQVAIFASKSYKFNGVVTIRARWVREYPFGESAAHLIGYVGRISEHDVKKLEEKDLLGNYRGTDVIGKKGIEQSYEQTLHGKTGWIKVEVTATGKQVRVLSKTDPVPGDNLRLSIDMGLQNLAEQAFKLKNGYQRGALVAIDPRNGQVLSYVSSPSFDPNLFIDGIDVENWRRLSDSPDHPLIDRPISGTFPIGSTYKPFVALASIKFGVRDPNARIPDPGYFEYGGQRFRNAAGAVYGPTNMHKALVVSSDTYFFGLGPLIGVDRLHDFSMQFGFGKKTGVDLNNEKKGILPSKEWKRNAFKTPSQQRWIPGETISVAVGQGYNSFTIMQLAQATSTLAANGVYTKPHIVDWIENPITKQYTNIEPKPDYTIDLSPESIRIVKAALRDVTRTGTAKNVFFGTHYQAAGKTGTAQVFSLRGSKYNSRNLPKRLHDHSLFMGFAPFNDPSIALALIVENGGWGATVAAPIARKVFDYWLSAGRSNIPAYVPPAIEEDLEQESDNSPDLQVPDDVPANPDDAEFEVIPEIIGDDKEGKS